MSRAVTTEALRWRGLPRRLVILFLMWPGGASPAFAATWQPSPGHAQLPIWPGQPPNAQDAACFLDGGNTNTFTQVTFSPTIGAGHCVPAGCGIGLAACSEDGGEPINWALSAVTSTSFTLTSVDPNALGTCTGDSLENPIVINYTAE